MVGYEIAATLADRKVVSPNHLIETNRISADLRSWLVMLLTKLSAAGLARRQSSSWILIEDPLLPSSASIIRELATRYPEHAGKLLAAAEITGMVKRISSDPTPGLASAVSLSSIALNFYEMVELSSIEANRALMRLLESTPQLWPRDRAIRVLQIGVGTLVPELISRRYTGADLTISKQIAGGSNERKRRRPTTPRYGSSTNLTRVNMT